ncbi:FlaA1/EpsC-like NDP-sugar epimerase [Thiogranum longum]|uniref:FlaA1/EpsC-like NDP-sugar epimerase n=1 Tax=Thiogranum longum TaxID=1537524 RepID=A0A4R1HBY1_9GAMM|nr:nucleoside-diphosphate sugar epimerase/dehydratase [Thiogranum longum]TCK18111.1 FlaA1/EpsC-like NDP-sugar epimerase [Thiogranum longum]
MIKKIDNKLLAITHDLAMIPVAWIGAYWLRFNLGSIPETYLSAAFTSLIVVVLVQGIAFRYFGLYRGVWRFASIPDLIRISKAVLVGMAFSAIVIFLMTRMEGVPRSVFPLYGLLLTTLLGSSRLLVRWSKDHHIYRKDGQRVLIVGAGKAGEMLVRDLLRSRDELYYVVGFVDDSIRKHGQEIHGVRVLGACDEITDFTERLNIDLIVLALPSATSAQMRRLVRLCDKTEIPVRTLPPMDRLMSGQVILNQLREVSIDDLLGREPVRLDWQAIKSELRGRIVLVSGSGGSIGSELCRQIARLEPSRLILLDNSEFNLYSIEMEMQKHFPGLEINRCLNDVVDRPAIEKIFEQFQPEIVFHAAAYKHVPMLEDQIREAARNNVLGTRVMAEMADLYGSEAFVMISTDKAVNPANVMGTSKRAAEIFCQNLNQRSRTRFVTVRFGNVLGSAGSVVPLFKQQIEAGGPVTVTHREITRYFMTIPEACQLILQASIMGAGGEIFVLDMGESVKITFLAEQMIRLSGKVPGEDIDIIYTGLRPGEKLYEELFHEKEALQSTPHDKILLARYREFDWQCLSGILDGMAIACNDCNEDTLRSLLAELVPEWSGYDAGESQPVDLAKGDASSPGPESPILH